MPAFTLKDAAKIAGVSRPTIYRYVSEGKLSVTEDERGVKRVDAAELKRVFPSVSFETGETGAPSRKRQTETGPDRVLEVELRAARELLEVTRQALQSERDEKARLLGVVEAQTRMLEDRRTRPAQEPATGPTSGPGPVGWFAGGIFLALVLWAVLSISTR
jgi:excisionase family DNA binding protein